MTERAEAIDAELGTELTVADYCACGCGAIIDQPRTGRRRKYASPACRQWAYAHRVNPHRGIGTNAMTEESQARTRARRAASDWR